MMMNEKEIKILLSYHRHDIEWIDFFAERLKPFYEKEQLFIFYNEVTRSSPTVLRYQIDSRRPESPETFEAFQFDIIMLLISNKYLSLNDLIKKEISEKILPLIKRGTRVIPVYLEDCPWQSISWLREIKLWPSHQLPFSNMSDRERENHISRFIKDELKLSGSEEDKSAYREEKDKDGEGYYGAGGYWEHDENETNQKNKTLEHTSLQNDFIEFLKKEKHYSEDCFEEIIKKDPQIDLCLVNIETSKPIAIFEFKLTSDDKTLFEATRQLISFCEEGILGKPDPFMYIVCPSLDKSSEPFEICKVSDNGYESILINDFPTYDDLIKKMEMKTEASDKKLTLSDFTNGLDFEGSEICDKVITIAVRFSGLDIYFTHKSYVNFELRSVNSVAAQLHRYGENENKIALVIVGPKKGVKVSGPKMTGFVTKGEIAKLSGYKKGPPGELAWLNGNLRVQGTREKASVYVIKSEILKNPEASKEVHELLKLAKEYVESKGPVELERKKSDPEMDDERGGEAGEISQRIPGVSNDNVVDDEGPMVDRLGIEGEVNALSAMIAAKGTEPPLSIGLFGDWGSGKSFFMGKMRQRITAIAEESEKCARNNEGSYFCQNIVQIPFNAWHYMDANLWASLVTHIFDELAEHLSKGKKEDVEDKRRVIFSKIESAKRQCKEAEKKEKKASEELQEVEGNIANIEKKKGEREKELKNIELRDVLSLARKDERLKSQYINIADLLGLKEKTPEYEQLEDTVMQSRELCGQVKRVWNNISKQEGGKFKLLCITGVLFVLPLLVGAVIYLVSKSGVGSSLSAIVGEILLIGGGYAKTVKPRLERIRMGLSKWEEVTQDIDKINTEKSRELSREEIELREIIKDLKDQGEKAGKEKKAAEKLIEEAKEELEEIKTGRRLHKFIVERSGKSEYRDMLGIISIIREDFDKLSKMITESKDDETPGELRKIERIVLYIDDLDRCPSDRVVEVLQAIHLILAFKLFIVVVGVDCRWILNALRKEYSAFGGGDGKFEGSGGRWLTTPHNYVEKIFQIPFALEQMEDDGYRELVTGLTGVREQAQAEEERGEDMESPKIDEGERQIENPEESEADKDKKVKGDEVSSGGKDDKPDDDDKDKAGQEEKSDEKQVNEGIGKMNMTPDELLLEEWEIEFMKELGDFVSSPRAAKRFVNIYMLICATLTDGERLAKFKGTKDGGGDYQAVQLMLGILTGFPNQACDLLKAIRDNAKEEKDIREFLKKLKMIKVPKSAPAVYKNIAKSEISETERGTWDRLHKVLEDKITKLGINNSFKPFGDWAGLVGRFSFQYGRASELQADENEEEEKKMAAK